MKYIDFLLGTAKTVFWWLGMWFLAVLVAYSFVLPHRAALACLTGLFIGWFIVFLFACYQYQKDQSIGLWPIFIAKLSHALPWNGMLYIVSLLYNILLVAQGEEKLYQSAFVAIIIISVLLVPLWKYLKAVHAQNNESVSVNENTDALESATQKPSLWNYVKKMGLFFLAFMGVDASCEYLLFPFCSYDSIVFKIAHPLLWCAFIYFYVAPILASLLLKISNWTIPFIWQQPGSFLFYLKRHFYIYLIGIGIYDACISLIALSRQTDIMAYLESFGTAELKDYQAYSLAYKMPISDHIVPSWFFLAVFLAVVFVGAYARSLKTSGKIYFLGLAKEQIKDDIK